VAVTAVVVSWNTRELLERCLHSLEPEARSGALQVWVVDNGSSDGSAAAARSLAPWARVLEPGANLGFGPAINLAASRTQSDWLLVANADVALEPGALDALLAAGADPRIGCVAPRLIGAGGATEHSVHPFPTLRFTAAFNLGLHRLRVGTGERLCLEGYWQPGRPRAVPWAIGACLLLRRHAFDQAGGFDERQWLFAEDLDLGWRLRDAGWITWYEPGARVLHASGAATGPAFGARRRARFMAATYATVARRRGRTHALLTGALNVLGAAARVAWMAPLALFQPRRRADASEAGRWLRAHAAGLRAMDRLARRG
jgi:N-acetylglucosaminyl-diphospho-decaprenol L-rhamnosyltransferase